MQEWAFSTLFLLCHVVIYQLKSLNQNLPTRSPKVGGVTPPHSLLAMDLLFPKSATAKVYSMSILYGEGMCVYLLEYKTASQFC